MKEDPRIDRRQIELLNALLLSLPGTPVIYYGDEISMGDNVYVGDGNIRGIQQAASDLKQLNSEYDAFTQTILLESDFCNSCPTAICCSTSPSMC